MNVIILASGHGTNAKALLEAERSGKMPNVKIVAIISDIANAPVLDIARSYGVNSEFLDPQRTGAYFGEGASERYIARLREIGCDLIVLAGFMRILPQSFIEAFPNSIINLHPSLLPSFKGRNAIGKAFEYGVKICGCTVHRVSAQVDGGKILAQMPVPVLKGDTLDRLESRVHDAEHILLPDTVAKIASGEIE